MFDHSEPPYMQTVLSKMASDKLIHLALLAQNKQSKWGDAKQRHITLCKQSKGKRERERIMAVIGIGDGWY